MNRSPLGLLVRVRHSYSDPLQKQRAQSLAYLALVDLLFAVALFAVLAFDMTLTRIDAISLGLIAAISLVSAVLVWIGINSGSVVGASVIFVITVFMRSIIIGLPYNPTQIASPFLAGYSLPMIAAGVLLNRRATFVMILLSGLAFTLTTILNSYGLLLNTVGTTSVADIVVLNLLIVLGDGLLLSIFAGGQIRLLRESMQLSENARSAVKIGQSLVGENNLDGLFNKAIVVIRDQIGFYHAQIFIVEPKTRLVIRHTGVRVGDAETSDAWRTTTDAPGIVNAVIKTGTNYQIDLKSPADQRTDLLMGATSALLIPLKQENRILGVLDVQSLDPAAFDKRNIEILESIAAQLVIAINNVRLTNELRDTNIERRRLADQLHVVNSELERVGRESTNRAWSRYLENRGDHTIGYDWKGGAISSNTAISPTLTRGMGNSMPEIWVENGEKVLSVPILSRGQVLGAMEFRAPEDHDWNNRSVELARVIGQRLALALDNIRLFEQAQIVANREQVANQVASRLQARTDVDSLLAAAAESFQEALGASRASIRLGSPNLYKPELRKAELTQNGSINGGSKQ